MSVLRWAVIAASVFAAGALTTLASKALGRGRLTYYSPPRSRASRGIVYALGRGLLPSEKESARLHLASYLGGIVYHLGIFASLAILIVLVIDLRLAPFFWWILRAFSAVGFAAGIGLFSKRILKTPSRRLSVPDDFGANILVDVFLACALTASLRPSFIPVFFGCSIALLVYIPAGKIRHCFFFFLSRILFGRFFGRRGTLPARTRSHEG